MNIIFNREKLNFNKIFGISSFSVIDNMNKNNDDIANQTSKYKIKINKMGVKRKNIPLNVLDPFFHKNYIYLNCAIEISVEILGESRGVHMSRIGDVLATASQCKFHCIEDFIKKVLVDINKTQKTRKAYIKITAPFNYYEDIISEGKKNKKSLESIDLIYSAICENNKFIFDSGIKINNITACPCVQKTFKHTLINKKIKNINEIDNILPLLTHSQRCNTKILIKNYSSYINILELLKIVDKSCVRVQNTLPRDYELSMVYLAHKKPQFAEDVVREIAFNVCSSLKDKYIDSSIFVKTDSFESIHNFDISAEINETFIELSKII